MACETLFPIEWVREDGACIHLNTDNRCDIYETRPDYCRISGYLDEIGLPENEYYRQNATICNLWMAEDGQTDKFIPLTIFGEQK